jgi:hypothetical protein
VLKVVYERIQTCEEIIVKLEDELVECQKASRECAFKRNWASKGRFYVRQGACIPPLPLQV